MTTQRPRIVVQVTKLDAARRQLEMAIRLWFQCADPVSIHTLAAAARQILMGMVKKSGGEPMGADRPEIRKESRKQVSDALAKAENFFKHSSRDPKATLDFVPEATRFYILEAADRYMEMAGERPPILRVFNLYQAVEYPETFQQPYIDSLRRTGAFDGLHKMPRNEFFALALQLLDSRQKA